MTAGTITAQDVETTLRAAGLAAPVTTEHTGTYDYLAAGTGDEEVGVTWYRRESYIGPEWVFELDRHGACVSDAAETTADMLAALARELTAA